MAISARRTFETPDGLTLVADVAGQIDQPVIVLMHGGGQTRHAWGEATVALADHGYCVVNYDSRGHGESDWSASGDYSVGALATDLSAILATLPGRVGLVGASMGGMAGFYAVGNGQAPNAEALVLVDIVLRPAPAGTTKIRNFMTAHSDGFRDLAEAAEAVAAFNPGRPRPADQSGLEKNLRRKADGRLHWHWDPRMLDMSPSSEPPSFTQDLLAVSDRVTIPTLLIRGGQSDIVDDAGVAELIELVPQTQLHVVAKAGHMVSGDTNDAFNDALIRFLGEYFPVSA